MNNQNSSVVYSGNAGEYNAANISRLSETQVQSQSAYQNFDFANIWAIDGISQTPYLQALGRHPLSNAGTPAPDGNSALVQDVLRKTNFDRSIIQRDIFSGSGETNLGALGDQDPRFQFESPLNRNDVANLGINNPSEFLRQVFEGFQTGGNFESNVILGGDQFNFDVGADHLNLPEAMAIEDLFKLVFGSVAVQPAKEKPVMNSTGTVVGKVTGDVRVVSTNGQVYQVTDGMVLADGDRVLTGEGASVDLKVDGENKSVTLKEKTVVGVSTKDEVKTEAPQSMLMLAFGQMSASLKDASASSSFEVQTPVGISGMRG